MRLKPFLGLPLALGLIGLSCAPTEDTSTGRPTGPEIVSPTTGTTATKPVLVPSSLGDRIATALHHVHQRDLLTTNSFWTVFHGILGMGPETTLRNPLTNERVNAIDYITAGGEIRGLEFIPTRWGLDVRTGPQFVGQGHQDQFVAEMGQQGMTLHRKFVVNGRDYTFEDFVKHSEARVSLKMNQELSWAICILSQFRGTNYTWVNAEGEKLHFDDVVRYELDQPINDAACGGTHRLFGLTWAYHLHLMRGGKTEGVWVEVAEKIKHWKQMARKYQNSDGAFSTRYLAGPGNAHDAQLRIGTTGHVLEWLALALSDLELREEWVQNAANALAMLILENQNTAVESGALYHATHGLHIYHARVFGKGTPEAKGLMIPLPPVETIGAPRLQP